MIARTRRYFLEGLWNDLDPPDNRLVDRSGYQTVIEDAMIALEADGAHVRAAFEVAIHPQGRRAPRNDSEHRGR